MGMASYQINFGGLTAAKSAPAPKGAKVFRLAVMGDFSARAHQGLLETGDALAERKPLTVDCDNLDAMLARLAPRLKLASSGEGEDEIAFESMEDFHPDALYEKLEVFSQLSGLRQRLKNTSTFAKAAQEMRSLGLGGEAASEPSPAPSRRARGSAIPVDGKLSDFARLVGQPTAAPASETGGEPSPIHAFLRQIVAPHLAPVKDPRQDTLVAALDESIGDAMRQVLGHPDFQALESLWRSVDFLVRRVETDETLQIVLLDVSAEELAADLSREDQLENTALYRLLVEQPAQDARLGAFSAIVGNYVFDRTPPHAELLGRLAKIAAQAGAPFIAAVPGSVLDHKASELHHLTQEAWDALRALPEAASLGLAVPRFLLRLPYGDRTDSISAFDFEEFTPQTGLRGMLWGNPAVVVGLLLAETFRKQGARMRAGSIASVGEMPFYCYEDADGDQTALPCTERYITTRVQEGLAKQGFLPMLAVKNSPEVRVGAFRSVAGGELAGWWVATPPPPAAKAPEPDPEPEPAPEAEPEPAAASESTQTTETTAAPAAEADSGSGDAELDALLQSVAAEAEPPPPPAEGEVDADLEKLLKEMGM
jgi:type VI secretion system ImpC/EvpB family protein/type VI secretion system ImpB/VipA family protein